jgi:hypothetical protein
VAVVGIITDSALARSRGRSATRKSAMKRIEKMARNAVKASPATPRRAEMELGIVAASFSDPSWTFSAPPVPPSHVTPL